MKTKEITLNYFYPHNVAGAFKLTGKRTSLIYDIAAALEPYQTAVIDSKQLTTQNLSNALRQKKLAKSRHKFTIAKCSKARFIIVRTR